MSRRRRHGRALVRFMFIAPPAAALAGWADLGQPGHAIGLVAMLVPGMLAGLVAPGLAASAESLPLLLVPDRARIWWRHRNEGRRPSLPGWLRRAVYAADRNRCCYCGSGQELQLDHVKPWSRGGLSAMWNMMTLCGRCNRVKSNFWIARDGYRFYRPWSGAGNEREAEAILRYELRHRWGLGRWIRAGWSLSTRSLP